MTLDAFATLPHYVDHLAPIWWALDPEERGTFYAGRLAAERAEREGMFPLTIGRPPSDPHQPTLVAGYADLRQIGRRPAVFVEHGTGQTYGADPKGLRDPSYSGGTERHNVVLFLAPNERVQANNVESMPGVPSVLVGAPKLDAIISGGKTGTSPGQTVAVSFHWDCRLVPESRSAWPHYDGALTALAVVAKARGWHLLGHGHPRLWGRIARRWEQLGVELVPDFDQVLRRADLYVADNSSTLYEFAAVAGPVVVLNAPWYRRDVHHGLRFWDLADVGVQVDEPGDLVAGIEQGLADTHRQRLRRREVAHLTYPLADGHASARAADAIRAHVL